MSRHLRTKLPNKVRDLTPKIVKLSEHNIKKHNNLNKTKLYYNKNCKKYPTFCINQQIYFKKNPKDIIWTRGTIVSKTNFLRSFKRLSWYNL